MAGDTQCPGAQAAVGIAIFHRAHGGEKDFACAGPFERLVREARAELVGDRDAIEVRRDAFVEAA